MECNQDGANEIPSGSKYPKKGYGACGYNWKPGTPPMRVILCRPLIEEFALT